MSFDLFENENTLLTQSAKLLERTDATADELRAGVGDLLKGYDKLFKGTQKILRMSDRNEQKVKEAHNKIQLQQQELTQAHTALEHYAESLEETVRVRTQDLVRSQEKLKKLVELGISLAAERDSSTLLENILLGGKTLAHADAGTLYLRTKEDFLRFVIVRTDSLGIAMGGKGKAPVFMPAVPMYKPNGEANHHNVATHAALTGETVVIDDAYDSSRFDFSGVKQFDQGTGYRSRSFLTVPLRPRHGKVIGVMQLINALDPITGQVVPFAADVVGFIEALAAQAAITLDNQLLLQGQKELFDSFIKLIASAIDAKSPYTGGHCERVPELATLLAQSACDVREGPFADFAMTEDERGEMRIASWLHDCGKVTTPEYVVDKATKLEGIFNRIHEVRLRFEVLHRDAEIAYLGALKNNWQMQEQLQQERDELQAALQEEFAFVARCNVGSEFMKPIDQERIRKIAKRTWKRHFDDRLGLSHAELKRKGVDVGGVGLSNEEALLADKPEHVIAREINAEQRDLAMGIKMPAPKHLYNMGEIYNLCIDRGTLTAEERYKINEHVIQTLTMLEKLPFPEGMDQIPEIAGAHHETMIGNGYPRQLKREDMSIPARIMAIADVFEALTATDRPYKEPKTLSQAIKIMSFMKKDGHIDPDLFELFLRDGVYKKYADKYLQPFQIDAVDITPYLNARA
ncbi:MAG: GAF domain-containing protein [Magnetococcales bacterium]|nr:GAF domain-containing protein [Magnetococcales bacterium]